MLLVLSKSFNPFHNLATEEFFLKQKKEDIIMLWRSAPSVIIGKHQNANAEINHQYVENNNLTIARRLSGGGTVVHDLQNLNFTYLANAEEGKLIDFKRFLQPIIKYLKTLGIEAHIGKTNDLRIGELKISGNAEHVYRKRVLHHGTLLFNSDLKQLGKALNVQPGRYIDKAVQSNRSTVTNISSHLKTLITIDEFTNGLLSFFKSGFNASTYSLSANDHEIIQTLITDKYMRQDWIWGYSPKYSFVNTFTFNKQEWKVAIKTEKGKIVSFELSNTNGETINTHDAIDQYHNISTIRRIIEKNTEILHGDSEKHSIFSKNLI